MNYKKILNNLFDFFAVEKEFSFLSLAFFSYLIIFLINHFIGNSFLSFFQSVSGFFFAFMGAGVSIVLIFQWILKRKFEKWEFISLSLLASFLVFPIILNAEYFLLKKVYDWYPIANSIVLWMGAGLLLFFKKTSFPEFNFFSKLKVSKPLWVVLAFGFIFTLFQVFLYPTLPDLDPYKWFLKYTYQFANQQLDYIERPLFGSLVFIGTRFMGLSILSFFKYILPFLPLLVLFPAWMVAKTFQDIKKQYMFLLFVFASPAVILYVQTAMPQSALIILSYFFLFFLVYSHIKRDDLFLYLSGAIAFLSFFFHQSGVIIFIVWLIVVIIEKRKIIFSDKKTLVFILLLIVTNLSRFKVVYEFATNWLQIIISRFYSSGNLNLLYPAVYSNIDKNSMGWGSMGGVLKFYAFHAGLLVGAVLLMFFLSFCFSKNFRSFLKKFALATAYKIVVLSFLIYFFIAEVLPRYPNIALLPDRAWIFAGLFSFIFLFLILSYVKKVSFKWMLVFLLLFAINITGALYINYLKKYLITPAQMQSSQWIKENLPEERVVVSYGHKSLLPVYASSPVVRISAETFCAKNLGNYRIAINSNENVIEADTFERYITSLNLSKNAIESSLEFFKDKSKSPGEKHTNAIITTNALREEATAGQASLMGKDAGLIIVYPPSNVPELYDPIPIENVYSYNKILSLDDMENKQVYIYYARKHNLNPYQGRPYQMTTWGINPCLDEKFLFDLYPEKFKRIYSVNNEEVIIWKVL